MRLLQVRGGVALPLCECSLYPFDVRQKCPSCVEDGVPVSAIRRRPDMVTVLCKGQDVGDLQHMTEGNRKIEVRSRLTAAVAPDIPTARGQVLARPVVSCFE